MSEDQPLAPPPAPAAAPEPVPFWGYADLFLLAGLALPCMFLGWALVRLAMWVCHWHTTERAVEAVPEMLLGYTLLFTVLMMIFRMQYDRPFWHSLGWTPARLPFLRFIVAGFATTVLVGLIAWLIRTPPTTGPLVEMMKDRGSLILLGIFGTTAAPLCEELAFRGFLQPLLVRDLGAVGGIALAASLFGGLHYSEYGDSWRSALLVAVAGAAFGCVRHWTGSTRAAVIMHASFNGLQFAAILAQGQSGLH
jgi:hypothetical protein